MVEPYAEILEALNFCHLANSNSDPLRQQSNTHVWIQREAFNNRRKLGMGTGNRKPAQTGLSIAVNQSKTRPLSKRFGFLCMLRVPGGVIKLSAPTSLLASQCLPSATIKQPFQNLSSLVPCPLSLCSEAF